MKYENSIVVGTSNFALQCAEKLREYLPVSVIENKFLMFSSLTKKCQKIGISCIYADKNETMEILRKTTEKTIIISALNIYLFPKDIVEKDNLTIINCHPALLPKYPGRNSEAWAIYEGETETGVTFHYINSEVDAGEMIAQFRISISETVTGIELFNKLFETAYEGFCEILPNIMCDTAPRIKLNTNQNDIKLARDVPNNGILDANWTYEKANRFLRCMDYGVFSQFPKPKMMYNGEWVNWKKYSFNSVNEEKDSILLKLDGGNILLRGISKCS